MGSGASAQHSDHPSFDALRAESNRSADAQDITNLEEAKIIIANFRGWGREWMEKHDEEIAERAKIARQPVTQYSFRGKSLKSSIKMSLHFVDDLLARGYNDLSNTELEDGFQCLKSTLSSPMLGVMMARHGAQEDLQKKLDTEDDDVNDFIAGHYASDGIHDVSLVQRKVKAKFNNAMKKLKVNIMVKSMMGHMSPKSAARQRTSSFFAEGSTHLKLVHTSQEKDELEQILRGVGNWSFDVWDLVQLTNDQPLLVMGMELIKRWNIDVDLDLKDGDISTFFREIENGYLDNPYHNNVHGADVMYTVHCFMESSKRMHEELSSKDVLAALVAAAAHDFRHDGVNNAFHVNVGSELATLYNDRSVLENMHAAELFKLCKEDKFNIFKTLGQEDFKDARKIVTMAILGTDMTKHFNHIADFQSRLQAEGDFAEGADIPDKQRIDKYHMIEMALHCADISNPAKPIAVYQKWVLVVMNEFFAQGDRERDLGMPISPMFDRHNTMVSKTQGGFIDFIIKPIYKVWGEFIPELKEQFDSNLEVGRSFDWDTFYAEKKDTANLLKKVKQMITVKEEGGEGVEGLSATRAASVDVEGEEELDEAERELLKQELIKVKEKQGGEQRVEEQ